MKTSSGMQVTPNEGPQSVVAVAPTPTAQAMLSTDKVVGMVFVALAVTLAGGRSGTVKSRVEHVGGE